MTGERAISLHFKVYGDEPNKVWHAEEQRWYAYDLDTKIAIYADRVRGWFLDFGRRFTSEHNCGFIVLMIGGSYLEGNQQFRDGVSSENSSKRAFSRALRRVFPSISDENAGKVYKAVRNGLFHDAMTKAGVGIGPEVAAALALTEDNKILLNPDLFIAAVVADFDRYILELNNSEMEDLRVNFERLWDQRAPPTGSSRGPDSVWRSPFSRWPCGAWAGRRAGDAPSESRSNRYLAGGRLRRRRIASLPRHASILYRPATSAACRQGGSDVVQAGRLLEQRSDRRPSAGGYPR